MTKAEYLERLQKIPKMPWYQQKMDALLSLQIELAEQELAQEMEAAKSSPKSVGDGNCARRYARRSESRKMMQLLVNNLIAVVLIVGGIYLLDHGHGLSGGVLVLLGICSVTRFATKSDKTGE